jgi:hypothetical protein
MRRFGLLFTIATLAAMLTLAVASEGKEIKVSGEILDMACFLSHGAKGPDHAPCAVKCAKAGQPIGLLSSDGTVYLLFASHEDSSPFEKAKDLAGQQVEIQGKSVSKGSIQAIEVASVVPK